MAYAIVASHTGDASVLKKQEIELAEPKAGEVNIRHTAIGVNFIDIYIRTGLYPWPVEKDLILGTEGAGVIEAIGAGVTGFAVGERVAYTVLNGAYASHRTIAVDNLVHLPDSIDDKTAAAIMLKGLTAHYLLHRSYQVMPGDNVLFHAAAGGVGSIAGQWLMYKGVTAIGTAGGAEKCVAAKANGYTHIIDYKSEDFITEVKRITQGLGVDAVYDSVGKDTYPGSLQCLKNFGTFVSFGQSSGVPVEFKLSDLAQYGSLTATRPVLFHFIAERDYLQLACKALFQCVIDGHLKIHINQEFALGDTAIAHNALESRQTTGCTILVP